MVTLILVIVLLSILYAFNLGLMIMIYLFLRRAKIDKVVFKDGTINDGKDFSFFTDYADRHDFEG